MEVRSGRQQLLELTGSFRCEYKKESADRVCLALHESTSVRRWLQVRWPDVGQMFIEIGKGIHMSFLKTILIKQPPIARVHLQSTAYLTFKAEPDGIKLMAELLCALDFLKRIPDVAVFRTNDTLRVQMNHAHWVLCLRLGQREQSYSRKTKREILNDLLLVNCIVQSIINTGFEICGMGCCLHQTENSHLFVLVWRKKKRISLRAKKLKN